MALPFLSKIRFKHLSLTLAVILLIEGLAIAALAKGVSIDGIGGVRQGTVMLAGLGLFLLGLIALLSVTTSEKMFKLDQLLSKIISIHKIVPKLLTWMPAIVGMAVLIGGLAVALMAAPMTIRGGDQMDSFWLAGLGAQLFALGAGLVTLRLFKGRESLPLLIRKSLFLLLATIGVLVIGIASRTSIVGIGGIKAFTVELAGAQLMVLALLGVLIMYMDGRFIFGKKVLGHRLGPMAELGVATIIGLEGLVLASLSAKATIIGIGVLDEIVMLLGGLFIALLALLIPASYYLLEKKDVDTKKLATSACLFLVFLLPFSLLM